MTMLPEKSDFAHVRDWVFDLDNTLYPHHVDLFAQIDRNMTAYVSELLGLSREDARAIQKRYYHDHGTTLKGLMLNHGIDPSDFLEKAHAIDYGVLQPDMALGILDHFDDIFDIVAAEYVPKPADTTYDKFTALHRVETERAAMFEDLPRNLVVPKTLGMKTVLLLPRDSSHEFVDAWETLTEEDRHIDYTTSDLAGFLQHLVER